MADFATPVTTPEARPTSNLTSFARTRPLTLFFLFAYAWSCSFWLLIPRVFLHGPLGFNESADLIIFLTGAFGPMMAALTTRWLSHRDLRICHLWTGTGSLLTGLLVGVTAFFVVAVLAPTLALLHAPLRAVHWSALLQWSTYAVNYSTFLGGPIPEEPGWRGFALPKLQARYGPYAASIILALFWAGWHLPLFWIKGWSSATPWQFLLILIGISFLFTAAANLSRFNVLVAIVLHASFNTSSGVVGALLSNVPQRDHPTLIYTFTVFATGSLLGAAILKFSGISASRAARTDVLTTD